jgi:hypothetical protein
MPPVFWEFQGDVLVVKFVDGYSSEQVYQAFTEAVGSSEYRTAATLLMDARSAFDYLSPETVRERIQFMFDSVRSKISRCAIVTTPHSMVMLAESAADQFTAMGMHTSVFTRIEDGFAWLKSLTEGTNS